MLERCHHCSASLSINSECMEVMTFGGTKNFFGSEQLSDTAILQLSKSLIILLYVIFNVLYKCHLLYTMLFFRL